MMTCIFILVQYYMLVFRYIPRCNNIYLITRQIVMERKVWKLEMPSKLHSPFNKPTSTIHRRHFPLTIMERNQIQTKQQTLKHEEKSSHEQHHGLLERKTNV